MKKKKEKANVIKNENLRKILRGLMVKVKSQNYQEIKNKGQIIKKEKVQSK